MPRLKIEKYLNCIRMPEPAAHVLFDRMVDRAVSGEHFADWQVDRALISH